MSNFFALIHEVQQKCSFSRKIATDPNSRHPWTRARTYKVLQNEVRLAKNAFIVDGNTQNREALKHAQIAARTEYNRLRTLHYEKIISATPEGRRNLFEFINTKRNNKSSIPIVMHYGESTTMGINRNRDFARHLSSCFGTSTFPCQTNNITNYELGNSYDFHYDDRFAEDWRHFDSYFSPNEVLDAILSLDHKKSCGPMNLATQYIKYNTQWMSVHLSKLFNGVYQSTCVPQEWKLSFLVPVPKKGRRNVIENYRGIAIQSVIPKLFDQIITHKIQECITNIIPRQQHGFMKGRSTTTNLIHTTQFIRENIDNGRQVDVLYLDYSKAFDRVDHGLLARKLATLSMPKQLYLTIMNFITNRRYQLNMDGKPTDNFFETTSGVPQGSHCGPILFLLFTYDITEVTDGTEVVISCFADDTKLFRVVDNVENRIELQLVLDRIHNWSNRNRLELNVGKTYHTTYSKRGFRKYVSFYHLGMQRVQYSKQTKDLGVIFDETLSFAYHIKHLQTVASQSYGFIYRVCKELNSRRLIIRMITIYVLPIVEYASVVWTKDGSTLERTLESILHKATRAQLNSPYRPDEVGYINFEERCNRLNMLTFNARRKIATIVFAIGIFQGRITSDLQQRMIAYRTADRITRVPLLFNIGLRSLCKNSPLYRMMKLLNEFRVIISLEDQPSAIKNKLKIYFRNNFT